MCSPRSGARKFIPEQSENLHLSRSAANLNIPIKQLSPNTVGQIDGRLRPYLHAFAHAFAHGLAGYTPGVTSMDKTTRTDQRAASARLAMLCQRIRVRHTKA